MPQFNLDNYYTLLGVTKSSSKAEIKKSFMRLSLLHHPDKIKSTKSRDATPDEILFYTHLKDAYEVLSSNDKQKAAHNRTSVTATSAPIPAPSTAASTSVPPSTVPPRTRVPSIDSTSSDDAASSARPWWWGWFYSAVAAPCIGPILDRIVIAVFAKKIQKLRELLIEYQDVPAAERASHVPKLNWLLVESAAMYENEIALLLTKFGADVNHYGEFMKLADNQSFDCYFVDMLIHMNNFALFAQILSREDLKVDLTIYSVGLYVANNWPNPHLHHYPKYEVHGERYEGYVEDYHDEYEHNCRKRLLWCAIFCGWVLEHNRPDLLAVLKDISAKTYKAELGSCYFEDIYRFLADNTLRIVAAKSFTTERIVNKFLAANNAPRFWQLVSHMQIMLDMRINIYPTSLAGLCGIIPKADTRERLLHLNEMLNVINNDVDPIRKALAWHLSYYWEYGGPAFLLVGAVLGAFYMSVATHAYFDCGNDNPPCSIGTPSSVLFSYALGGFSLYILLTTALARILSCGYLEIGGTLESVVNRAAINLVINQYATQQVNTRSPFVGFSFRSSPSATVEPDVESNELGAYHSLRS